MTYNVFGGTLNLAQLNSTYVAADSLTSSADLSVDDYKFLSRLDALFDVLHAVDVLEDLQASDTRPFRSRRQAAHVYSVRQYIRKCCRQGFCDSADFC